MTPEDPRLMVRALVRPLALPSARPQIELRGTVTLPPGGGGGGGVVDPGAPATALTLAGDPLTLGGEFLTVGT
jgi:hypothetical protein